MRKRLVSTAVCLGMTISLLAGANVEAAENNYRTDIMYSMNRRFNRTYYLGSSGSSSSSSSVDTWWYNTGTELPQKADYTNYGLTLVVRAGDIIYEAAGGLGITGHAAIVEGLFYDSTQKQYYIRIIEAISDGVVRSVLDASRVDYKSATIYRVSGATTAQRKAAVDFCVSQLGDSYNLDFAKDTSSSESDWYCSELVWAAYKNQGIDIEVAGKGEPGVTPRDITVYSSKVTKVAFK